MKNSLFWRFANALLIKLIWPISRQYSRYFTRDKPADSFLQFISGIDFLRVHRYWPDFKNPKSFSEKIFHRMLFDRDRMWTMLSDKFAFRDFVKERVGEEYLVSLIWTGKKPEDIPFKDLPEKFVIKANHGCAYNIIVKDKLSLDQDYIRHRLTKWLNQNFAKDIHTGLSWAYRNITPYILIEPFIGENDEEPIDYKFFCYQGKAMFVQVNIGRFGVAKENFFDREYNFLDIWNGLESDPTKIEKPQNYETMLLIADTLSKGFDFIRVDLYSIGVQVYVGELTCYPAGGRARFVPMKYDFIFGEKWQIV